MENFSSIEIFGKTHWGWRWHWGGEYPSGMHYNVLIYKLKVLIKKNEYYKGKIYC